MKVDLIDLKTAMAKAKAAYNNGVRYYDEKHKTYNPASTVENILEHVSDLVGFHGIESYEPGNSNPSWPTYQYVNSGDSYGLTVVYNADTGRFMYTDIGSIIEANEL